MVNEINALIANLKSHPETHFVLAVSGGVDSMVLWNLFERAEKKIVIAHVHHHQRRESDAEMDYLKKRCLDLDIPFYGHDFYHTTPGNFHAEARQARYHFFQDVANKEGIKTVVLAHHLDDQAETFLMKVFKKVHWLGWNGMNTISAYQSITLFRPLLHLPKVTLYRYALEENIPFFEDRSNYNTAYSRNHLRHHVLPVFVKKNSDFIVEMERLRTLVERFSTQFKKTMMQTFPPKLARSTLLNLSDGLQLAVFKVWLEHQLPRPLSLKSITSLMDAVKTQTKPLYHPLIPDTYFISAYGVMWVETTLPQVKAITIDSFGEYRIESHIGVVVSNEKNMSQTAQTWELCYNKSTFPIVIRHRKKGDVILMSYGQKKVKDICIDLKIPRFERERLWLIESQGEIKGIFGLTLDLKAESCTEKIYVTEVSYVES